MESDPVDPQPGYRSKRIRSAPGVAILPIARGISRGRRLGRLALDVAARPVLSVKPREHVEFLGERIPLRYDVTGFAWRSERTVELAIGAQALAAHPPQDVLEVGNVMSGYGHAGHHVVDKYERRAGVLNEDIVGFDPGRRYGLVLSFSTLEHVGRDEEPRDPDKAARALESVSNLVASDGALLVSIPVDYHRELEGAFVPGEIFDSVVLLVRCSRLHHWEPRDLGELPQIHYDTPYPFANGLLVGVRGDPFRRGG
jgi:hypothetical protein